VPCTSSQWDLLPNDVPNITVLELWLGLTDSETDVSTNEYVYGYSIIFSHVREKCKFHKIQWIDYSQTCINGHLDIAWPCLMWPLSGPTDEIPYILNLYIAWPCPTRSLILSPKREKICPITVTIECVRLQFSQRVKIHATLSPIRPL